MNFLKKGPEIKPSEIKVPGFVQDVYYDLKERHLLPLAAILLAAIVVAPFVLSSSSSSGEQGEAAAEGAATATAQSAGGAEELVAKTGPGLRDYRRRLNHLKSKNPFRQQYRRGEKGGEGGGSGATSTTTTVEASAGEETTYEVEAGGTGGSGSSGGAGSGEGTWYSYAIDVKVTTGGAEAQKLATGGNGLSMDGGTASAALAEEPGGGGKRGKKTKIRKNLPQLTMLPSREAPALTYMGSTKDGKKALMLISSDVTSLFGDARCVIGSSTCQLLALEAGLPETVVYGGNNRVFKIELLEIHLVKSKKLNKAPIGKPRKHPEG